MPKKKKSSMKDNPVFKKVMDEFAHGELHSGSEEGPVVSNPKQAVAIAYSEARKAGAKVPKKKKL